MKQTKTLIALFLGLTAVLLAQEPVAVRGIAVDKLLEGVRVTIACDGSPNVSSFVSSEPPAVVIDVMDAVARVGQDRIASNYYPVSSVAVQPSGATNGVRVVVQLRDMVDYRVTVENNVIVVQLGTQPAVPALAVEPSNDPFAGKRLTLYVKNADVGDVVRMLAQQFNINMLVTQDVKSIVTVNLTDVPLRVGLEALLRSALCNMVEDRSGIIVVKPTKKEMYGETRTRVYTLDYVEADDAVKVVSKVLSEVGSAVEGFRRVGTSGGGAGTRNAVLVVTDIPEALERVSQLIADLDRPTPQILIEAKFVETTMTGDERYGFDWTTVASFTTDGIKMNEEAALPVMFNEVLLGKISLAQFKVSMEAMMARGHSRLLSNPRTMTLDNQTATISMGLDIPIREVHKDAQTGEITYTWKTRSVPIALEVTPHVTSDGMVTMKVKPSVEAITGWVGSADDQRPIVAKRVAETQVKVADGEVVVIGGLVKEETTTNVGKVPLLGDIPILGQLFRKTSVTRGKSDLMIFIIPHIVMPTEG